MDLEPGKVYHVVTRQSEEPPRAARYYRVATAPPRPAGEMMNEQQRHDALASLEYVDEQLYAWEGAALPEPLVFQQRIVTMREALANIRAQLAPGDRGV